MNWRSYRKITYAFLSNTFHGIFPSLIVQIGATLTRKLLWSLRCLLAKITCVLQENKNVLT